MNNHHRIANKRGDDDSNNIQIENIYGIPNDKEKLMMQAQKMSKQMKQATSTKKQDLDKAFTSFSLNLKESDFDNGMKLREELHDLNEQP